VATSPSATAADRLLGVVTQRSAQAWHSNSQNGRLLMTSVDLVAYWLAKFTWKAGRSFQNIGRIFKQEMQVGTPVISDSPISI